MGMDGVRYCSHLVIRLVGKRRTKAYLPLPLRCLVGSAHARSARRQPRRQLRA